MSEPGAGERRPSGTGLPTDVKRILVLGAGRSGTSAATAVAGAGREVLLSDRRAATDLPGLEAAVAAGVVYVPEDAVVESWPLPDLVIKSPGVPVDAKPVMLAGEWGVPVWSELELAYVLFANPFDAITGTNGKTTTTALLGHLFATAGRPARVLGNIGVAVTSVAGAIGPDEELVVEVSSFQLEDIHTFRPACGVFLNLTPDHLDRHGTMERYLASKAGLFTNQRPGDVAVLNALDASVAGLGRQLLARENAPEVVFFSSTGPKGLDANIRPGSWIDDGWVYILGERLLPVSEIRLPGVHNLENSLAAATAAVARGVERKAVREGLQTFTGVAHRLQFAGMVAGVTYVNDSKATNVEATLTALSAYPSNTHLILGGRDKASDYRPVARACTRGCKAVYLIGEATPLIEAAFAEVRDHEGATGAPALRQAGDLERALDMASRAADTGDVVLLAPACASFDQYKNFEERGDHFMSLVARLEREES